MSKVTAWKTVKNFETLKNLDHQPMGPQHMPIPHYTAIQFFKQQLADHGIKVVSDRAVISEDTYKLTYTATVAPLEGDTEKHDDYGFIVGFINNNDRSKAFTGIAGVNVYLNDAQMYISDSEFKAKHYPNVMAYLSDRTASIISWFKKYYEEQSGKVEKMKATKCTDEILGSVLLKYLREKYTLGSTNIKRIVEEYDHPKYEIFKERTLWSLQNTTNEVFNKVKSPMFRLDAMEIFSEAIEPYLK